MQVSARTSVMEGEFFGALAHRLRSDSDFGCCPGLRGCTREGAGEALRAFLRLACKTLGVESLSARELLRDFENPEGLIKAAVVKLGPNHEHKACFDSLAIKSGRPYLENAVYGSGGRPRPVAAPAPEPVRHPEGTVRGRSSDASRDRRRGRVTFSRAATPSGWPEPEDAAGMVESESLPQNVDAKALASLRERLAQVSGGILWSDAACEACLRRPGFPSDPATKKALQAHFFREALRLSGGNPAP